ncbi:MAG: DUF2490 domain-containing protein [Bacteroidales bacterium]|jgi:hypothetical protein|nr:DUF2490 domain-containing protein [Bacteroidales bacterium]
MIKKIVFIFYLSVSAINVFPQEKDFGIWYNIEAEKEIVNDLKFSLAGALRTFSNASKTEEYFIECELDYKINKHLSLAGNYRFNKNIEDNDKYYPRHRWAADFNVSHDIGRFDLSGRFRLQQRNKTYFEDKEDKIPDVHARFRLKAVWKTPDFPINPYTSLEFYYPLNKEYERDVEKKRFIAGMEYKISRHHFIEVEYMRQRDYRPVFADDDIIGLTYLFEF